MKPIKRYRNAKRGRDVHRVDFESLGELMRDCKEAGVASSRMAGSSSWWGGDSISKLLDRCIAGDERRIGEAERLLDKLREEIEIPKPQWQASQWGAFPSVPDYLSGEPDCMRMMAWDPNQTAPVKVWFDPTSSAAIGHEDLAKRGTAVLALVMGLSQIRPVELWTFSDLDAYGKDHALITAKIQTNPLMLSEACFALCNPGYARGLTYSYAERRMDFQGYWGFGDYCEDAGERVETMRASLRADPMDVVIPGINRHDELLQNPLEWVRREIRRHTQVLEQA